MRRLALLFLTALLLSSPAFAENLEDAFGTASVNEAVPDSAKQVLGELQAGDADADSGILLLLSAAKAHFSDILGEILRPMTAIVAVCLLCSAGDCFSGGLGAKGMDVVSIGGCLAIAVIGMEDVRSVLSISRTTLTELQDFSRVLLPTLTTAAAASGAVSSAGAAYTATALFSELLLTAADRLILPMICAYAAAAASGAVLGDQRLDGAVRFLQWAAKLMLKALVLCFTAYLTITGILAGTTDAATVKTAKTLLSVALPVVGKLLSDASEALVAGAGMIRGAIGLFGMLVCLATVLLPLLRLGLRCLMFRAAAAVCSGIAGPRQTKLIAGLGNAYAMLLGLVGCASAIAFLGITALVRTVTV